MLLLQAELGVPASVSTRAQFGGPSRARVTHGRPAVQSRAGGAAAHRGRTRVGSPPTVRVFLCGHPALLTAAPLAGHTWHCVPTETARLAAIGRSGREALIWIVQGDGLFLSAKLIWI